MSSEITDEFTYIKTNSVQIIPVTVEEIPNCTFASIYSPTFYTSQNYTSSVSKNSSTQPPHSSYAINRQISDTEKSCGILFTSNKSTSSGLPDGKLELAQHILNTHPDLLKTIFQHYGHSYYNHIDETNCDSNVQLNNLDENDSKFIFSKSAKSFLLPIEANILRNHTCSVRLSEKKNTTVSPPIQLEKIIAMDEINPEASLSNDGQKSNKLTLEILPNDDEESKNEMGNKLSGFILLSVCHEKFDKDVDKDLSNLICQNSFIKNNSISKSSKLKTPCAITRTKKTSRRKSLKLDNTNKNILNGSQITNPINSDVIPSSRFRVTRIADVHSWWHPRESTCPIMVHDLKTSVLPDNIIKLTELHLKMRKKVSINNTRTLVTIRKEFWRILDPDYKFT